ncbi:hypothetical protein VF21_04566 [Pseudogymnoascus sp. 05NY08]|nr:hypothetical protein VF21_04566 [Pseudogymnoascus sp. 05NY08]
MMSSGIQEGRVKKKKQKAPSRAARMSAKSYGSIIRKPRPFSAVEPTNPRIQSSRCLEGGGEGRRSLNKYSKLCKKFNEQGSILAEEEKVEEDEAEAEE